MYIDAGKTIIFNKRIRGYLLLVQRNSARENTGRVTLFQICQRTLDRESTYITIVIIIIITIIWQREIYVFCCALFSSPLL